MNVDLMRWQQEIIQNKLSSTSLPFHQILMRATIKGRTGILTDPDVRARLLVLRQDQAAFTDWVLTVHARFPHLQNMCEYLLNLYRRILGLSGACELSTDDFDRAVYEHFLNLAYVQPAMFNGTFINDQITNYISAKWVFFLVNLLPVPNLTKSDEIHNTNRTVTSNGTVHDTNNKVTNGTLCVLVAEDTFTE